MKYKNIVLIGMPGCGKSTIGKKLAKEIGFEFIDTDRYIEKLHKKPLFEIFRGGEEKFKQIEQESILGLNLNNYVISTGGSVVLSPKIMEHLKKEGLIIYLHCNYEIIEKRINDPFERTVVGSEKMSLKKIYDFRLPLYKKYADKIFYVNKSVKNTIESIISQLDL